ncbi:hypothetical protein [Arthrobacter sp. efr-133-TYG-118]|uniref:GAP1-M domain-containing protein n=1 Tax=Arthrobacter sp. efr-133-TYG-118 TaxID=3040279 RepID=UPI00254AC6F7|nr:hypothetical protein [Arthrobacter sp. efr-133-TYG-118]
MTGVLSPEATQNVGEVRLEQLIYTWANQTLTGQGFGVVGCSPGWPIRGEHNQGGLGGQVRYLRQGAASLIREGNAAPEAVAYRTDPEIGRILLVKLYLGQDSHGRDGRYLVHALADRGNVLNPLTALLLACSPAIVRSWPLDAAPNKHLPPIILPLSPAPAPPLEAEEREQVRVILEALLDYIAAGTRSIVISQNATRVPVLLAHALGCLPHRMQDKISFSTFESSPRDCGDALIFASPSYSDCRSIGRDQTIRHLPASPADVTESKFTELSRDLIERTSETRDELPDLETVRGLESYLRAETYFSKEIQQLSPEQTIELFGSPLAHRWLSRPHAIQAVLAAIKSQDRPIRSWLRPEQLEPKSRRALREALLEAIISRPFSSKDHGTGETDLVQAFLTLGGSTVELEQAVWDKIIEPAILNRSLERATIDRYPWVIQQNLDRFQGPILEASIECESLIALTKDRWHPMSHRMILRSWVDPGYARSYDKYLEQLYQRFQPEILGLLEAELQNTPTASRWAERIAALPPEQSHALMYLLTEHCDLGQGWLFDLVRSPDLDRSNSVWILAGYLTRILMEEGLAPAEDRPTLPSHARQKVPWTRLGIIFLSVGIGMIIARTFQPSGTMVTLVLAIGFGSFAINLLLRPLISRRLRKPRMNRRR